MANSFNDYFSNIATNLKSNIFESGGRNGDENYHQTYLKNSVSNTLFLNVVEASEVYDVIRNFKNKTTRDTKIISLKLANKSYNFTSTLASIVNKSFQQARCFSRTNETSQGGSSPQGRSKNRCW